jgi:hypothetical protein
MNNLLPTAINESLVPDTTNTVDLGSPVIGWKNIYLSGAAYLDGSKFIHNTGTSNTFMGSGSGALITSGNWNTATGAFSLFNNTTGYLNCADGESALYSNTTGFGNAAIGARALYYNSTGSFNTATGTGALYFNTIGQYNTANGYQSLYVNTTGNHNTAVGLNALTGNTTGSYNIVTGGNSMLSNTVGSNNTAYGYQALNSNIAGSNATAIGYNAMLNSNNSSTPFTNYNVAVGYEALRGSPTPSVNTGNSNTAIGYQTLRNNTTGLENCATGASALLSNTTGHSNVAVGVNSLNWNSAGNYNTACGFTSLGANSTGTFNTALGSNALGQNTTGTFNVGIGTLADVASGTLINAAAIGWNTIVDSSNKVRIGDPSVTSIGGQVNWTTFSDARIKNNIEENVKGLEFINLLRPVTYHYDITKEQELLGRKDSNNWQGKFDIEKIPFSGFIAQEVEEAARKVDYNFSGVDKNGRFLGLRYAEFVVPLVKAVQELNVELKVQNEELKKENMEQQMQIDELKLSILNSQSSINNGIFKLETSNAKYETLLGQNIPNPFDKSTVIPFRIPEDCNSASIVISETATGKIVIAVPVSCHETNLVIKAGKLAAGSYSYSLFVDGKVIGARQMVLTR